MLVTTRLCLELGLLADPNRPPVMVCNVDIEPPGSLIEQLIEPLPAGKEHLLLANQEPPKSRQESAKSRQEQPQPVDVLNSISHDLEYLLNNGTCEEVTTDLKTPL
ncbi:hypothetical protein AAG570_000665 [Ranatra chinensis]|uniref:Uncharacterized protein n=1 Tax=Ranatra chinensis TaxID=642074 RepID=A0ABD0YXR2_9HEMI